MSADGFTIPYGKFPTEPKEMNKKLRKDILAGSQNLRGIIQNFLITVNYRRLPEGLGLDMNVKSKPIGKGSSAEQVYHDLIERMNRMLPAYQEFLGCLGQKTI